MSDQEQQTKPDGGASVSTAMLESLEPIGYIWQEVWKDDDTQYGPGDYNSELIFDTKPPIEGVEYLKLYTEEQVIELLRSNV